MNDEQDIVVVSFRMSNKKREERRAREILQGWLDDIKAENENAGARQLFTSLILHYADDPLVTERVLSSGDTSLATDPELKHLLRAVLDEIRQRDFSGGGVSGQPVAPDDDVPLDDNFIEGLMNLWDGN